MNLSEFMQQGMNHALDEHSFGKFVRQRREELGLTVRGMAADLGMTPAYVSDIEKGNRYAPIKFMEKLREILQIPDSAAQDFEDLAAASRGYQFNDITPYLGQKTLARVALRKARDCDISNEKWEAIIKMMDDNT